jgi:hypothetical protein
MKTNYDKHKSKTRTNIQFTENMTNYEQQLKLEERHLEQKVFQVRILFTSKDEWSREE